MCRAGIMLHLDWICLFFWGGYMYETLVKEEIFIVFKPDTLWPHAHSSDLTNGGGCQSMNLCFQRWFAGSRMEFERINPPPPLFSLWADMLQKFIPGQPACTCHDTCRRSLYLIKTNGWSKPHQDLSCMKSGVDHFSELGTCLSKTVAECVTGFYMMV